MIYSCPSPFNIASTQIDVYRLREVLLTYTNTVAAYKLSKGFSSGFKLCYKSPRIAKLVIIWNPWMVLHSKQWRWLIKKPC